MLQTLHGAATKWVGFILFALLTLSFVIWGIADVFRDHVTKTVVARVGPLEVTGQQLQVEVQREIRFVRSLTGRNITMQQALETGLVTKTLNDLLNRALLEQEAQRQGLRVPTSVVLAAVRDIPDFKKESDGSFDGDRFRAALANAGMSEQTFLYDQRINLAREQLNQAASAAVTAPALLQRALNAAQSEKRTVETYRIKLADQVIQVKPEDATLQAYLDAHRDDYMRPAYRKLSFVHLNADTVADDSAISDDEIAQAFESRKGELAQPEQRSFVQALTTSEEKARAIVAAASTSHDLTAAAKANGVTATQLMSVAKTDLPAELQDAGFGLASKAVSAPVQSGLGYHILQLTNVTAGHEASLDASRKRLTDDLRAQKASDTLGRRSQQADDLAASGAGLDEIAGNLGVKVQQTALLNAEGKDEKGTLNTTLAPEALAAAFKLGNGQTSGLIAAPGEQYYLVHVDNLTEAAIKPLAEVRAQVLAAWQKDRQQELAQQQADKVAAALKDGKSLDVIAKQFKVESAVEKDLNRASALPAYLPPAFGPKLFGLKQGDIAQTTNRDSVIVARVASVSLPVKIEDAKATANVGDTESLQDALSSDLSAAYAASLRQCYPVTVDQGKIAELFIDKSQQEY